MRGDIVEKDKKRIIGWIAVIITIVFSSLWAYWGSIENFHEGWYSRSVWENLFMMFFQYLIVTIVFVALALITLKWKRVGLALHILLAAFCVWFFAGASFSVVGFMIVIPIIGIGLLYYFGDPKPKKWAYRLILLVPLVIILAISVWQGIKVSQRINDNNSGTRVIAGNEVTLVWAPRGPGWPDEGVTWEEAQTICRYLSGDGTTIMEDEQNIWRLPTVDEAVRSMMLHGESAGGIWDPEKMTAEYERIPDKETPLWDVYSPVIYYWTADTSIQDEEQAYIIVYNGGIFDRRKTDGQRYLSFRAVKDVE